MKAAPSPPELQPVWVIVPAAGRGARMGSAVPKQHLPLAGKTVLHIVLQKLLGLHQLAGLVVATAADDGYGAAALEAFPTIHRVTGGNERAESVLQGLNYLMAEGTPARHWVLVHDAARPCVLAGKIEQLRHDVVRRADAEGMHGGILAKPVADTLKRGARGLVQETCDRSQLWQAHTPQMFRLGELQQALQQGLSEGRMITDEASAIEQWGGRVLLVEDRRDNIKITHPEDLPLAEMILQQQEAKEGAR